MKRIVMYFVIFSVIFSLVLFLIDDKFDPRILVATIPTTFLFFYWEKRMKRKESTLP